MPAPTSQRSHIPTKLPSRIIITLLETPPTRQKLSAYTAMIHASTQSTCSSITQPAAQSTWSHLCGSTQRDSLPVQFSAGLLATLPGAPSSPKVGRKTGARGRAQVSVSSRWPRVIANLPRGVEPLSRHLCAYSSGKHNCDTRNILEQR